MWVSGGRVAEEWSKDKKGLICREKMWLFGSGLLLTSKCV
jgi:hypothetical protein